MEETTGILLDLFIIFAAAKIAGEIFQRLQQPALIGEVLAGILIGPHALGLIGSPDGDLIAVFGDREAAERALEVVFDVFAEFGVIILLFFVGLQTRVDDLLEVRNRAVGVALLGVTIPFAVGFGLVYATGRSDVESAFVATALVATSVGITARVLADLGAIDSEEARIILGAAVVDDILGLMLLAIVRSWGLGDVDVVELSLTAIVAVTFVVFAALVGTRLVRSYSMHFERLRIENAPFLVAIIIMLGLSALAGVIGLAAIIGAFLAGLMLAEADERLELERHARPVYDFLVPFFFVLVGAEVDLGTFEDLDVVVLAFAVTGVAVTGKAVAGFIASRGLPRRTAAVIAVGMVPRGEVGLVVAGVGSGIGAISGDTFAVVVFMSIATTLIAPWVLMRIYATPEEDARVVN